MKNNTNCLNGNTRVLNSTDDKLMREMKNTSFSVEVVKSLRKFFCEKLKKKNVSLLSKVLANIQLCSFCSVFKIKVGEYDEKINCRRDVHSLEIKNRSHLMLFT